MIRNIGMLVLEGNSTTMETRANLKKLCLWGYAVKLGFMSQFTGLKFVCDESH